MSWRGVHALGVTTKQPPRGGTKFYAPFWGIALPTITMRWIYLHINSFEDKNNRLIEGHPRLFFWYRGCGAIDSNHRHDQDKPGGGQNQNYPDFGHKAQQHFGRENSNDSQGQGGPDQNQQVKKLHRGFPPVESLDRFRIAEAVGPKVQVWAENLRKKINRLRRLEVTAEGNRRSKDWEENGLLRINTW